MKTDDLILRLSAGAPEPPLRPSRMALVIGAAVLGPLAVFVGILGTRPDLVTAWGNPVVPFKTLLPLVTGALSITLLMRLTRPEKRLGWLPLGYLLPLGIAAVLWIGAFLLRAPEMRFAEVGLRSVGECLGGVLSLSAIPTAIALRVMRSGASTHPGLSAALAGLTAASGAAAGYSLFCTRDNPLFYITWYGLGIVIVTLLATRYGKQMLVW